MDRTILIVMFFLAAYGIMVIGFLLAMYKIVKLKEENAFLQDQLKAYDMLMEYQKHVHLKEELKTSYDCLGLIKTILTADNSTEEQIQPEAEHI